MENFKIYKTWNRAYKAARNRPILRVGDVWLVGDVTRLTEVSILDQGHYVGQISMAHLVRLGNADHAEPGPGYGGKVEHVFPR